MEAVSGRNDKRKSPMTKPDIPIFKISAPEKLYIEAKVLLYKSKHYEALSLFKEALNMGCIKAGIKAGEILLKHPKIEKDSEKSAVEFFKRAIGKSKGEGEYLLAKLCYTGSLNIRKDHVKARELFFKAATQEHNDATYYLGKMYLKAEGGQQFLEFGLDLLESIKDKDRDALDLLGAIYLNGKYGVKKNAALGMKALMQAASIGSVYAKDLMIRMHQTVTDENLRKSVLKRNLINNLFPKVRR